MKKIIISFLIIILLIHVFPIKFLKSQDLNNIEFFLLKDDEQKFVSIGKGKFKNFSYSLSNKDDLFILKISGKGNLFFKIIFKEIEKVFPEIDGVFVSPFYILKDKEEKLFMFSIDSKDLHYFEAEENEENFEINYNLYLYRKELVKFRITKINSIFDAFENYYKFYGVKERKIDLGGLILPNVSLTTIINNVGIENFNIKGRLIDPQEQYAPERILEGTKYKIENFVLFDPIKLKFENIDINKIKKELYFNENPYYKLMGLQILTSSIKNKEGNIITIEKKSEPTFKIVSGEKVPDYKENSVDTIIFLNPEQNFLKNKGINSFDIYFSRYIYPLNIAITMLNRQLEIKGENEAKYIGLALDFSYVEDFFNFDKRMFNKNPKSYIDGEIAQFYCSNLYNFLNSLQKDYPILSINPKYYQLIMNSDLIYKEVDDLNYLNSLPIERVLVPNRPIVFSFRLKNEDINENILNKIFKYSLIYGIYPTFSKPKDEPFSIWDNIEKLKLLAKYKDFYDLIGKIESKGFTGKSIANIENGEIYQFGVFPDLFLTINGYGKIRIEKSVLESQGNISIINPLTNEKVEFYEEENNIIIDSWGLNVLNIKKEDIQTDPEREKISKISKFENKKNSFLIFISILLFIILNLLLRKVNLIINIKPFYIILILFLLLLILNHFFGLSSPFFILLSIGVFFIFTSTFSSLTKKSFLLNFSLVFLLSSLIFYILNGNQINLSPPSYLFYNTYFISIVLTYFIFIFYHFEWKKIYDILIFSTILIVILISNPTRNPFYSPPIDYTFLISSIILALFIFLLSKNTLKIILFSLFASLIIIYIFIDKIYFYLLSKEIFISVDFIQNLILLFSLSITQIYFSKSTFKTKTKLVYNFLIIFFLFVSIYLNRALLISPHIFGIISSIIKLIFYIILIIYLIFFVESTIIKKEE